MNWIYKFIAENSHEIYCWSWALGICSGFFIVMLLIAGNWDHGYAKGYEKGFEEGQKK